MRQVGFTLVELMVVVLILSVVAAAVLTTQSSSEAELTLDAAAAEVAAAFRFARSEAIRTGDPHGVYANPADQRVRVYREDDSVPLPVPDFSVLHPVDKKPYDLNFDTEPVLARASMASASFLFAGVPASPILSFDPSGTPSLRGLSDTYLLLSASVSLTAAGRTRVVSVAPMTGRVTIQ